MTNALDPRYPYICPDHVSAMMTFLECFDRDLPRWNLSVQTRSMIEPRIAFCRQIIAQRQEDCTARGEEPPSSALFRETIIRNGGNIDEVVYDNPCYNYYHMSFFGHHSIISWVIIGAIQSEPLEKPETARRQAVVGRVMSAARDE